MQKIVRATENRLHRMQMPTPKPQKSWRGGGGVFIEKCVSTMVTNGEWKGDGRSDRPRE